MVKVRVRVAGTKSVGQNVVGHDVLGHDDGNCKVPRRITDK